MSSRNKQLASIFCIVLIVAGVAVWYFWLRTPELRIPDKAFYSDDDGQTYFVDDLWKVPPFDHNGKTAVRAYVFSYDGGKKQFVAYLMKYDDEMKNRFEQELAATRQSGETVGAIVDNGPPIILHISIKRPGLGHSWSGMNSDEATKAKQALSPDGSPAEVVIPE